jgi:eukaryotic-like serine/threonine-protein kinase
LPPSVLFVLKPYSRAEVEFELEDEIGLEGQNSRVYRAHDPQLNARIVIKKIAKNNIGDIDGYFAESSYLYAGSHNCVVPIKYACQDEDHVYLAMPYFAKGSLKSKMAERFLTVREIVNIATQILSALHHIHSKKLIHFDIKPDNILISDRGEALLSDFGLARQMERSGTAGQDRIYGNMVPPESFATDNFSNKFDIYQIGLTLYRMCVGDNAFSEQYNNYCEQGVLDRDRFRHAVVCGQFPCRDAFPPQIPQALASTVKQCLSTDPNDRFQSAIEIVNSLAKIEGNILDWQYTVDGDVRSWSKSTDERVLVLRLDENGNAVATRKVGDGVARRIVEYSKGAITRTEIRRFLKDH